MWKLPRPTVAAQTSFATCISSVRDQTLKAQLVAATSAVVAEEHTYDLAAAQRTLHTLGRQTTVGAVSRVEMEKVYTDRMAKQGSPGRPIYDQILAAANERCPLCGFRQATTLDHQLPKKHYPALVVTPINLVPACKDCNKAKSSNFPTKAEEVSLHPYYDDVENDRWLYADVHA